MIIGASNWLKKNFFKQIVNKLRIINISRDMKKKFCKQIINKLRKINFSEKEKTSTWGHGF